MGIGMSRELALQAEVRRLRERIANLEKGRQREERQAGAGHIQSLAPVRVPVQGNTARHTGITIIGDVPWGTHFCEFYRNKQELIETLVPYFKAGLENNEFCMWVTSEPLCSAEAKATLTANVENLETYIADGQLEILDHSEWYTVGGTFESDRVLQGWIDRVETATRRGFDGLRLIGNTSWLKRPEWQAFREYEAAVNAIIGKYRMLALCAYSLPDCGPIEIIDVISNHAFALIKRASNWERIDSAERKKVGASLRDSEARFRALVTATSDVVYRMSPDWKEMLYLRGRDFIADTEAPSGDWLQKYILREDQPYVTAVIDEAIRNKYMFELEHRVLRVDGSAGWTFSRAIPIQNAQGEVIEWFGAASDITGRKRAEEALRRSEARWNAAIENLAAGIVIATDTERVIYRNPAARALHGFTSDQDGTGSLHEMSDIFQLWTPDGRLLPLDEWPMRRIKRGETLNRLELRLCRPDQGWEKIISYSGAMVESAIGERLMFVSAQDLSNQRKAEQSLRESQESFQALADNLPDSFVYQCVEEPDGTVRYTHLSAGIQVLNGIMAEDVLRDAGALHRQILPEHMDRFVDAKLRSKRDLSDFDVEIPMRRTDGVVRWMHCHSRPRRLPDGRTIWDGVQTDVTARKLAEDELNRLAELLKLSCEAMIVWKLDGGIESWNLGAERLYGYSELEAVGKLTHTLLAPRFPKPWDEILTEMRMVGSWEGEVRQHTRDSREVVASARIQLIKGSDGIDRVLEVNRDITEARRAQLEGFERQKLESLGTLASGIAHDFNNLLGAVLAQADLAAAALAAGSHPSEELEGIREVALRGSDIVRQLMIYAGKESEVLECIDLSKTIAEMSGLLKSAISKRVVLVTDLSRDLPAVRARTSQVCQVVMNLVVNASDAIKDNSGEIRVTTQRVTLGPNTAGATTDLAEGDYVQLEVSDTGTGMSHEIQARMFDPFFSTKSAGRGLGLPVIHGIVRGLRGGIRAESEVGKGTTFQILLPSEDNASLLTGDTAAGEEQEVYRSSAATVLLVEDEAPLRLAVKKMLGRVGFTVLEAADGSEAVELLHSQAARIDLLLLDMTIPGCSSQVVLSEAVKGGPQMKVIVTSAYSEEMVRASLPTHQIRGFIRKPFQLRTLLSTLQNALSS